MDNRGNFGELIQGLNKGLEPGGVEVFPLVIPRAVGDMAVGA
jgi:hypothetical protein